MAPAPRASRPGSTAWVSRVRAVMLTAIVSSRACKPSLASGLKVTEVALLIRVVIAGSLEILASIRASSGIVGLRGAYDIPMDWGVLAPMARLEYRRVIENDVTQALSYANEGGIVYPMLVNGLSRNLFQAGLGLRARRDSSPSELGVSGEIEYLFGTAGSQFTSHALRGAVKVAWSGLSGRERRGTSRGAVRSLGRPAAQPRRADRKPARRARTHTS